MRTVKRNKKRNKKTLKKRNKKTLKKGNKKTLKKGRFKRGKNKKKRVNKVNYKKEQCAPKKKGEYLDFSCYTPEVLYKMRNIWNRRHPDVQIASKDLKTIWESLGNHMKNTCDREACWINDNLFKDELEKEKANNIFSPKSPKSWKTNKNEWLSSVDILKFMKQYENAYHCFEFFGPSPIDYDTQKAYGECVWEDLCKFNLKDEIDKGKKKMSVVFNLDPHYKTGSHWVSLFINCNLKEIYYFDSYGDVAPTNIRKFARTVQDQSVTFGNKFKYFTNKKRHQYKNSECGMYCLYFITQMLKDVKFKRFEKKIPDIQMEKLRNKYFNI